MKSTLKSTLHILLTTTALCLIALTSCDRFLDVNKNPNFPETSAPSSFLPGIISNGTNQYFLGMLTGQSAHYVQHIGGRTANNARDQFFMPNLASPFNDTYFRTTSNIKPMIEGALQEGSPYYVGAGKTLMALWLFHLTDVHGDIPYSDAFRGAENYSPVYDPQEQVYASMFKLLDEALVEFNKPASANLRPLSDRGADLFFNGNIDRWKRLVFSLRARQLNHLTKKSTYNPQAVLAAVDSAMRSNADDAQIQFNASQVALSNGWAPPRANMNVATFGRYFINMLNGTTLGGGIDPRMRIIAPGNRGGVVSGSGESPLANRTDFYGVYNSPTALPPALPDTAAWYARVDGVQLIVTYFEVKFIEAEAAFRAGNRTRAFTAYQEGIRAHMQKLGVPAASITAYLASPAVAQSAASLTLANIMQQKYIAMFLHPEAWVDMRRMDYSTDIYPGFSQPNGANPLLMGQFPRRFLPAGTELLYNAANATREIQGRPEYPGIIPVWWDRP
jgi:hypothetical protein